MNRQLADGGDRAAPPTGSENEALTDLKERSKETLARIELFDKNLEKIHGMVSGLSKMLQPEAHKLFTDVAKPILERLEQMTRSKMQSLAEEIDLVKGPADTSCRDLPTCAARQQLELPPRRSPCKRSS